MKWFLINSRNTNELNNSLSIMIKGVKCSKPKPKAPEWFTEFANEQRAFNKMVINRLDNVEKRLNEHDVIFKRNNLI